MTIKCKFADLTNFCPDTDLILYDYTTLSSGDR